MTLDEIIIALAEITAAAAERHEKARQVEALAADQDRKAAG